MMNTNKVVASLADKMSASIGHRADLEIGDVRKIDGKTAHFLLAFASDRPPTSADLNEFFLKRYNAQVVPYAATAKVWLDHKVVTVVAGILNITREYEDIKRSKMVPVIAGYSYLDVPMQETYAVQERGGKKVLVKKVKDDIMAIVSARKAAMQDATFSTPATKTFAHLAKASGLMRFLADPEKGDMVRCMNDDKTFDGEVLSSSDEEVKVKSSEGGSVTIPKQAVLEVLKKGSDSQADRLKAQEDYYSKAYGSPEYGKELVRGK